ncbi:hypothetical protein B0919_14500 [Hymenobacter sp. CRA2]|nr:hypothetical protein B0919_14500 [Hymenobacter sp. CRA2]
MSGISAQAQQPTAPPVTAAAAPFPDIIVRTNGDEIPARVLLVGPAYLRYLAAPDSTHAATDTLSLARTEVFMVRFANGTKEVMADATPAPATDTSPLAGLTPEQRYTKGRLDARQHYKPAKGVFWGTFGASFTPYVGPLGGIAAGVAIGTTPPPRDALQAAAPKPELLNDPQYYHGFEKQAKNRKLGKAAEGFGVATGTQLVLGVILLAAFFSAWGG